MNKLHRSEKLGCQVICKLIGKINGLNEHSDYTFVNELVLIQEIPFLFLPTFFPVDVRIRLFGSQTGLRV